jgi:hypothetical protein
MGLSEISLQVDVPPLYFTLIEIRTKGVNHGDLCQL